MRKIICIFLSFMLLYSLPPATLPVIAADNKPLLSELSESECISFVKAKGIILPPLHEDESEWGLSSSAS